MAISYVSTGLVYANAGNVIRAPGAPGSSIADDLWIVVTWTRNSAAGIVLPDAASGYTTLLTDVSANGTLKIEYKIVAGGESAPTFGQITGTNSAQDTCLCQVAALRGTHLTTPIDQTGTIFTSASTSNIGAITAVTPTSSGAAVVVVGGKGDDWTSVDLLTGDGLTWTEIGEPDSTAGADAGLVWDVGTWAGAAPSLTSKTFVVTGGAANFAKGVMFSLKTPGVATPIVINPVVALQAVNTASVW